MNDILHGQIVWEALLLILACKLAGDRGDLRLGRGGRRLHPHPLRRARASARSSASAVQTIWPGAAARARMPSRWWAWARSSRRTTHAPIMAIIMLFEMTLDYQIILAAHAGVRGGALREPRLREKIDLRRVAQAQGRGAFRPAARLAHRRGPDEDRTPSPCPRTRDFTDIAQYFATHRFNYLYVVDAAQRFRGAISLHDIKNYLNDPDLAGIVIAARHHARRTSPPSRRMIPWRKPSANSPGTTANASP